MIWYNIELSCQKEKAFEIEEFLLGYGALSVFFTYQNNNEEFYEVKPGETPLWDLVKINAIFEKKISSNDVIKILRKSVYSNLFISKFKDKNWVKSYQEDLKPMQFGKKVWIVPSCKERKSYPGDVIIKMDTGMAFGSGSHETTALCLEYLDNFQPINLEVIDYGCGSGILGIASILLGANKCTAIDIDLQALLSTRENATRNNVSDNLITLKPEQLSDLKVDLIIANIFFNVLIDLKEEFLLYLKSGGTLILSGIMKKHLDLLVKDYEKYFQVNNIKSKNDWCLLELIKK